MTYSFPVAIPQNFTLPLNSTVLRSTSTKMNSSTIVRALERVTAARDTLPCTFTRTNHPLASRNEAQETSVTAVNDSESNQSSYVNSAKTTDPTSWATIMSVNGKHGIQHVLTYQDRFTIFRWTVENATTHGERGVICRTVRNFSSHFRGEYKANIVRASRNWRNRSKSLGRHKRNIHSNNLTVSGCTKSDVKKMNVKARNGCGRKCAA